MIFSRYTFRLIIAGLAMLLALVTNCFALEEGKQSPDFTIKTLNGQTIDAASIKGKVTIVHFWATWCDACRKEMPAIDLFYSQHQNEGLQIIAVSMDDEKNDAEVMKFIKDYHFPVAFERDSDVKGFGRIWAMPMTFVIDKNGILQKDGSAHPWIIDAETLEALVTPLLKSSTPDKN